MRSNDEDQMFKQLAQGMALVVDNDMCYTRPIDDDDEYEECTSYDFGPQDLAFIFGAHLGYTMEKV